MVGLEGLVLLVIIIVKIVIMIAQLGTKKMGRTIAELFWTYVMSTIGGHLFFSVHGSNV